MIEPTIYSMSSSSSSLPDRFSFHIREIMFPIFAIYHYWVWFERDWSFAELLPFFMRRGIAEAKAKSGEASAVVYKLQDRVQVGRQDRDCVQKSESLHLTELKSVTVYTTYEEIDDSEETSCTKLSVLPNNNITTNMLSGIREKLFSNT
jgi:hypothetical protein